MTLWGNRPPATYWLELPNGNTYESFDMVPIECRSMVRAKGQVPEVVRRLSIAFPAIQPDFWSLLTKKFVDLGYSYERIKYIENVALETDELINQYRFGRLSIADFTSITKPLPIISTQDAFRMKDEGRTDLVSVQRGYKDYIITTKEAADFASLKYQPF